jgi:D-glycero-alpha-D-manno-heptose-7-phosphate kinase
MEKLLDGEFHLQSFGDVLHQNWMRKRTLTAKITNGQIDQWYDRAMAAGAAGGKICGAGGGGFLLLAVEPGRRAAVRKALRDLSELPFGFEPQGSQVLLPTG